MAHTPDPFDQTGTLDTTDQGKTAKDVDPALAHTEAQDETDEAAVKAEGHQPPNRT